MARYPRWTGGEPCQQMDPSQYFADPAEGIYLYPQALLDACQTCPSLDPCREWGIAHERDGVWGGMSPSERLAVRLATGVVLDSPNTSDYLVRRYGERKVS